MNKDAGDPKAPRAGLFSSLRTRLIVYFCAVSVSMVLVLKLVTVFGVPFTPFKGQLEQRRTEAFRSLSLVADLKKERLVRWIQERHDDVHVWSESPFLRDLVIPLDGAVRKFSAEDGQGKDLWASVREEEAYKTLAETLKQIKDAYSFYRIVQIADVKMGRVFASTDGTDLGMKIALMPVFSAAVQRGDAVASDIEFDEQVPFYHFHLAHPIKDAAGQPAALLMATIDIEDIVRPMLHTGEGLGKRGEALLVNPDSRIVTSLKHPLRDMSIGVPLRDRIESEPANRAARGEEGIIEANDYRGVPVLAAYRHIPMGDAWGWGMVVKRDKAEVFAPIRQQMLYTALIGLLAMFATILLTYLLANNLSRPIRKLIESAQRVREGDLSVRAPVAASYDVGMLARTFNSMVQQVQGWRQRLENQVMERTRDLNLAKENLETEVAERRAAEVKLRRQNEFLNNVLESLTHPFHVIDANDYTVIMANSATRQEALFRESTCYTLTHRCGEPRGDGSVSPLEEVKKTKNPAVVERIHVDRRGRSRYLEVHGYPVLDEDGNVSQMIEYCLDVTERKRAEELHRVSRQFLDIANRHTSFRPLLEAFVEAIKQYVDCEAVGVRVLDKEGNIHYEAHDGFSQHFYESESPLSILTDRCMCISVIKGETDPSLPYFTEAGSFCINGTTHFLATVSEEEKGRTRNACNAEGFESVALIPVRLGEQILGLIHVADSRENAFPPELVETLEVVGLQLGPALQRVWAEENLREREAQYRNLVEGSRDLVWRVDRSGRFTFVNPATTALLGYGPNELVGESFETVMAAESLEVARDSWRRRLRGELPMEGITIEFVHRRKDGTKFVAETRTRPVYGEGGELIEMEGVTRDVTERKQAEERLAWDAAVNTALSNLYRPLVSPSATIEEIAQSVYEEARGLTGSAYGYVGSIDPQTGDLVSHTLSEMLDRCSFRPEGKTIRFARDENGSYPGLWGYSLNTHESFFANAPETHPASRELPEGHTPVRRFLSVPVLLGEELVGQIALANKEEDYVERDLEAVGRLAEYYALAIQHQRAAEAVREQRDKASQYLDIAGVMLVALDADQQVRLVNKKGCEILGCSEDDVFGTNWFERFVPPEDQDRTRAAFERMMKGVSGASKYHESTIRTAQGEERLIAWSNTLLRDGDGRIVGTLSSGEDITERKIAEEKIRQSLEEKEVLLRELYHRVKNNLQVVSSLLRLQSQTIRDEEAKQAFEDSQNRIRSIALVHEKLYQSENLASLGFREYVAGLTETVMRAHVGETGHVRLKTSVDDVSLDLRIAVPCALLINELLSNALNHAFPGGRQGEVEIGMREKGDHIELVVQDNGIGLPADLDYRKTDSLGLRLIVTLAENQLRGDIELTRNQGTRFAIRFPRPHVMAEV